MTGGQQWKYDGIAGVANTQSLVIWSQYGYAYGSTPSLTTTAVASPSDTVMIAQSGNYDFMWQQGTADSFDLYFSSAPSNTYGANFVISAPMARARDNDGPTVGFYPYPSGPANKQEPTGQTIWTGVDGHAKSSPWRSLMGATVTTGSGQPALKAFWPSGS